MSVSLRCTALACAVLLLTVATPVQADPTAAEQALTKAFGAYCANLKPDLKLCAKDGNYWKASLARQYLALEAVCTNQHHAYCTDFAAAQKADGHETLAPLVLALDHETGRWHTRNRLQDADAPRVTFDAAGEPTVSLARQERITVVVENTNPLLYRAIPGKPTEADVPELASIQALLKAVGGGIAALVAGVGPQAAGADPLGEFAQAVEGALKPLAASVADVDCAVSQTVAQTNRAIAFVQSIELRKDGEYVVAPPPLGTCSSSVVPEQVRMKFDELEKELAKKRPSFDGCAALLDAALKVAVADPAQPGQVKSAFRAIDHVPNDSCSEFEDLKMGIKAQTLGPVKQAINDKMSFEEAFKELEEDEVARTLAETSAMAKKVKPSFVEAEKIVLKRDEVTKAAVQIQVFEERLHEHRTRSLDTCGSGPCVKSDSLDCRLILEPQLKAVRPTKIQSHSVSVKLDSPYKDKVVATRPAEVSAGYKLDSILRGLWGISASVVYTELDSPTFGAVTSEEDPSKKVIAVTDETTRAGDIALLADFRLGRWFACRKSYDKCESVSRLFGIEVGAAVSGDPGFFAGISLRPSRSWRVGFGYTYQQVKALRRGQELGQVVASADDIRTRDDFEGDWYISLSFALDSLTLFSAGD